MAHLTKNITGQTRVIIGTNLIVYELQVSMTCHFEEIHLVGSIYQSLQKYVLLFSHTELQEPNLALL